MDRTIALLALLLGACDEPVTKNAPPIAGATAESSESSGAPDPCAAYLGCIDAGGDPETCAAVTGSDGYACMNQQCAAWLEACADTDADACGHLPECAAEETSSGSETGCTESTT